MSYFADFGKVKIMSYFADFGQVKNFSKTPSRETGCLGNPYFLHTGCLGIQFFDSPYFLHTGCLGIQFFDSPYPNTVSHADFGYLPLTLQHLCDLQDAMPVPLATKCFPPNTYLGKRRTSQGVTSILSMCLCSHTYFTSCQKGYIW